MHVCLGTQLSTVFAPGPEKIAHSDFTCELEKNMKADFSAGEVRREACWGGATSFLPKCSADLFVVLNSKMTFFIPSKENSLFYIIIYYIFLCFNILCCLNKITGNECDAPQIMFVLCIMCMKCMKNKKSKTNFIYIY